MTSAPTANGGTISRLLLCVLAVSVLVRVLSALYQGSGIEELPGVTDQVSYHELAVRVMNGHGFSFGTGWWPATRADEPTAHWSFLYTLFLSAIYSIVGPAPLVARLVQAVIVGVLHPLFMWRIGTRLFGQTVGLVSAALSAFYLYFAYYGGALVTESLYIVGFLWVLDAATAIAWSERAGNRTGVARWFLLGTACGVTVLLRQLFLLIVPVVLLWLLWQVARARRGTAGATVTRTWAVMAGQFAVTVAVILACVLPWTARNYRAFGQFVLLNTNAGFVFFWGNHPIHGNDFIPILPNDPQVNYMTLIPRELMHLNEGAMDKALLLRGLGFIQADPVRYLRLSASRAKEYFKFWPTADSGRTSNLVRILSFGLLVPFIVGGIVLAGLRRSDQGAFAGSVLLIGVAAAYTGIHLLTWALVRYRLPIDAIVMPFAAISILHLFERLSAFAPFSEQSLHSPAN